MRCREEVADPARETSRVRCPRVLVVVTVSDRAVEAPMLVAQANPAIARTIVSQAKVIARTSVARASQATVQATLVDLVRREIDLVILADQAHREIGPVTLAARDGRATSVAPAL
jgi:hypothetical protein